MLFAFALMAATGILYYMLCVWQNKRRETDNSRPQDDASEAVSGDVLDLTDGENPDFRYTY